MNRRALILAGLAALPSSALLVPVSAKPRQTARRRQASGAKPRARRRSGGLTASQVQTRIVTRTFTSNVPFTIPAAGTGSGSTGSPATPYPSTLQVSGFSQGRIQKVTATLLSLSNTYPSDIDAMLVSPGNAGVILMSDVGGSNNAVGVTLVFDQDAPGVILDPLTSGTFQPLNDDQALDPFPVPAPVGVSGHSLTLFNNTNPNGTWLLYISDSASADVGTLGGWSLTIRALVRVPHRHRRRAAQRKRPARRAKR